MMHILTGCHHNETASSKLIYNAWLTGYLVAPLTEMQWQWHLQQGLARLINYVKISIPWPNIYNSSKINICFAPRYRFDINLNGIISWYTFEDADNKIMILTFSLSYCFYRAVAIWRWDFWAIVSAKHHIDWASLALSWIMPLKRIDDDKAVSADAIDACAELSIAGNAG